MNSTNFKRLLTEQLLSNIGLKPNESNSLLWPNNYVPGEEGFAKLFSLNPNDVVYRIATEGIGNEKDKVNSVLSSALLPLLVFNPLFSYPNEEVSKSISIRLPGEEKLREFDNCFFEIRNTVIGFPSCVDVVLTSKKGGHTTLLFLESKFIEYLEDLKKVKKYGKSYNSLYLQTITKVLDALGMYASVILQNTQAIDKNVIVYIVAVINEFAKTYHISVREANNYLIRFNGIDFLTEHYEAEHLLSLDDAIQDLTQVCLNNGGGIQ